jgi:hypothetical protein
MQLYPTLRELRPAHARVAKEMLEPADSVVVVPRAKQSDLAWIGAWREIVRTAAMGGRHAPMELVRVQISFGDDAL